MRQRGGFTLIELLIVIVIIGILAAIAVPKFGKTREKAYYKSVVSDLRILGTQQELYFALPANSFNYAPTLTELPNFVVSRGVTVTIIDANTFGWSATGTHGGLTAAQQCGIYHGTAPGAPAWLATPGVVACTGE